MGCDRQAGMRLGYGRPGQGVKPPFPQAMDGVAEARKDQVGRRVSSCLARLGWGREVVRPLVGSERSQNGDAASISRRMPLADLRNASYARVRVVWPVRLAKPRFHTADSSANTSCVPVSTPRGQGLGIRDGEVGDAEIIVSRDGRFTAHLPRLHSQPCFSPNSVQEDYSNITRNSTASRFFTRK